MGDANRDDITRLLLETSDGNREALERLVPVVYDELRRLAGGYLRHERPGHTLQATALVHEAYVRLIDQTRVQWKNRAHFFGVAAQMMRRILVSHARNHRAAKRGSGAPRVTLDEMLIAGEEKEIDLVALDEALAGLAEFDRRLAQIVELRYFGGLTIEETAEVTETSPATVKRDWSTARAWLFREMGGNGS